MPKLANDLSWEGREEAGRGDNDNEREQHFPPLASFSSDMNYLQWRPSLFPLLHGPETDESATSKLALNGSQHFMQVYGNGPEARAFQSSVEGTFQFVTNSTLYNHSGDAGNPSVFQSHGSEAMGADTLTTTELMCSPTTPDGHGGYAPRTATARSMSSRGESTPHSSEQSRASTAAGSSAGRVSGSTTEPSSSFLSQPSPASSPRDPRDPPAVISPGPHASLQALAGELPQAAGVLEDEEVWDEADDLGSGNGGEVVLPPQAEPARSFRPCLVSLFRRRYLSI